MQKTNLSIAGLILSSLLISPSSLASNKQLEAAINDVQAIFTEWAGGRIERLGHYEKLVVEGIRSESIQDLETALLVLDNNYFDRSSVNRSDLSQMVDNHFAGSDLKVARLLLEASAAVQLSDQPMDRDKIIHLALYELLIGDDNKNDDVLTHLLDRITLEDVQIHNTWTNNKAYISILKNKKSEDTLSQRLHILSNMSKELDSAFH